VWSSEDLPFSLREQKEWDSATVLRRCLSRAVREAWPVGGGGQGEAMDLG
jgi:hypothetical protein